jgi:hypothetical protein
MRKIRPLSKALNYDYDKPALFSRAFPGDLMGVSGPLFCEYSLNLIAYRKTTDQEIFPFQNLGRPLDCHVHHIPSIQYMHPKEYNA